LPSKTICRAPPFAKHEKHAWVLGSGTERVGGLARWGPSGSSGADRSQLSTISQTLWPSPPRPKPAPQVGRLEKGNILRCPVHCSSRQCSSQNWGAGAAPPLQALGFRRLSLKRCSSPLNPSLPHHHTTPPPQHHHHNAVWQYKATRRPGGAERNQATKEGTFP
jgi:hypothetical protein